MFLEKLQQEQKQKLDEEKKRIEKLQKILLTKKSERQKKREKLI